MSNFARDTKVDQQFTDIQSEKALQLEAEIVYLYGAPQPDRIAKHYMDAITNFSVHEGVEQKKWTLPHLEKAYGEVLKQTDLSFDVQKAARFEFDLIFAQSVKANSEEISAIMVQLYETIFQSTDHRIREISLLRTFLYQYKIELLAQGKGLRDADIHLLKAIDKRSKEMLSQFDGTGGSLCGLV